MMESFLKEEQNDLHKYSIYNFDRFVKSLEFRCLIIATHRINKPLNLIFVFFVPFCGDINLQFRLVPVRSKSIRFRTINVSQVKIKYPIVRKWICLNETCNSQEQSLPSFPPAAVLSFYQTNILARRNFRYFPVQRGNVFCQPFDPVDAEEKGYWAKRN